MNSQDHFEGSPDPFPREDLTQRIASAARFERWREGWQPWLLGLAVTLLALAVPMERLWGDMNLVRLSAEEGRGLGVGVPLLRYLSQWMTHEQAGYALAAVSAGLTLPALRGLLITVGFPHGIAMRCVGMTALAPLALLGASSPVLLAPGALGATLIARELFRLNTDQSMRALWRVSSVFLLGLLLDPANLLLLPAAGLALVPLATVRKLPPWTFPTCLGATIGYCLWILLGAGNKEAFDQLLRTLLAGGQGANLTSLGAWLAWLPLCLGVGWLGILSLVGGRRTTEESPPPAWIKAWCLVALVPIIGGSPWTMPALGILLPLCSVGLADHLVRLEDGSKMRQRAQRLLATQLILGTLLILSLGATDPLAAWRASARQDLSPGDLVFSEHRGHLYLLRHRFGLATESPSEPEAVQRAQSARDKGQRVVLDGALPGAPAGLKAAATLTIGVPKT